MTSHRSILRPLALAAVLGFAGASSAEPIYVEYFVAQKPFKKDVTSTSVLDFRLYEDENCTDEIASYPIFAGNGYAHYFVDKQQRVRGGPKQPKALRIRAMIDVPTTATAPYLRVTGPGVQPIAEECQIQAGSPVAALGLAGEMGPAGQAGTAGAAGLQGSQGETGPAGAAGPQGPQGEMGPAGQAGTAGAAGLQGSQGETGPAGAAGPQGPQGEMGPAGQAGTAGAAGLQGSQGETGPAGAAGPQGPQGEMGPAGQAGTAGAAGLQGSQGETGPAGAAGPQGPQGEMGPAGPAGQAGTAGAAGLQGSQGETGPAGRAGADGAAGPRGPQGENGPHGPAGEDGTSGLLLGGNFSNVGDGYYLSPLNSSRGNEENTNLAVSSGTANKLVVSVGSPLDGDDKYCEDAESSVTVTLRRNGVDTGLSCTVAAGQTSCINRVSPVDFADGDLMSFRYNECGKPSSRVGFTIVYQAP